MGGEAKKKKLLRTMEEYDALQVAIMMMMLTIMMLTVIVMEFRCRPQHRQECPPMSTGHLNFVLSVSSM